MIAEKLCLEQHVLVAQAHQIVGDHRGIATLVPRTVAASILRIVKVAGLWYHAAYESRPVPLRAVFRLLYQKPVLTS